MIYRQNIRNLLTPSQGQNDVTFPVIIGGIAATEHGGEIMSSF